MSLFFSESSMKNLYITVIDWFLLLLHHFLTWAFRWPQKMIIILITVLHFSIRRFFRSFTCAFFFHIYRKILISLAKCIIQYVVIVFIDLINYYSVTHFLSFYVSSIYNFFSVNILVNTQYIDQYIIIETFQFSIILNIYTM